VARKRSERLGAKPERKPKARLPEKVPWKVAEYRRFRCPLCGMLPEEERLDHSPWDVEAWLQRLGGRGYMKYIKLGDEERREVARRIAGLLEQVEKKVAEALGGGTEK